MCDFWINSLYVLILSLTIFDFYFQNEISVIEGGAFSRVPNLIDLKLSGNALSKMPRLSQVKNLQVLDLADNK